MNIITITDSSDSRLSLYFRLTEAQLRHSTEIEQGIFIAESPKVIRLALEAGYEPLSLLCEERHITGDAADIVEAMGDKPVYIGSREVLAATTGYTLTRGVLCAMKRRALPTVADVCAGASRIAVIDSVTDTTNIGAIFRSAAALGVDGVVLTPTSCDPLNRRAVRVSMGTIFKMPWCWLPADDSFAPLRQEGFKTVAMALTDDSVSIDDPVLVEQDRLAIVLGTEGDGLSDKAIADADFVARIPMSRGVDSLNVAAASAVAFWQLRRR